MRKVLAIVLFSLFIFSMAAAQHEEIDPDTWDFGKVSAAGGIIKHTFKLKNYSNKDLNINGVHASCGCTVSEIDRKLILPNETALLEVQFNPRGYSGQITQYVYVSTDNNTTPIHKFIIKAEVVK
jgi:hypothetical protein